MDHCVLVDANQRIILDSEEDHPIKIGAVPMRGAALFYYGHSVFDQQHQSGAWPVRGGATLHCAHSIFGLVQPRSISLCAVCL